MGEIPRHLIVLGGGYVGLELAQAMRRFGSSVTIVERGDRLISREDGDVSQALLELFRDEGVTVLTGAHITQVEGRSGEHVALRGIRDGAEFSLEGSHLLVASGRTPNTQGIGLELAGVETTDHGFLKVNERLQTTAEGVWGLGDCAGSPHFTHVSADDFPILSENLAGGNKVTTGRLVPYCMFTDPELAHVGLSETEAKQQGIPYRVAKLPMAAVFRAMTVSETRGFMKILVAADSDRILGFTMFGAEAGEIMATIQTAMLTGASYTTLRDAIIAHPTMTEGLVFLLLAVPPKSA